LIKNKAGGKIGLRVSTVDDGTSNTCKILSSEVDVSERDEFLKNVGVDQIVKKSLAFSLAKNISLHKKSNPQFAESLQSKQENHVKILIPEAPVS
jgi:hypothetical protein